MTADCACASPKLTATSASNAVAQSGALNVARFIIDAPCGWKLRFNSGRLGQGPSGNNVGYTAPYSESPQYRNPTLQREPRLAPSRGKSPVPRAFPRLHPRDRLAETARIGAMRAHGPASGNAIRICIALSFFYIGLWGVAPLRAAQATSTPGDSAALAGQAIASDTRAAIGATTR